MLVMNSPTTTRGSDGLGLETCEPPNYVSAFCPSRIA